MFEQTCTRLKLPRRFWGQLCRILLIWNTERGWVCCGYGKNQFLESSTYKQFCYGQWPSHWPPHWSTWKRGGPLLFWAKIQNFPAIYFEIVREILPSSSSPLSLSSPPPCILLFLYPPPKSPTLHHRSHQRRTTATTASPTYRHALSWPYFSLLWRTETFSVFCFTFHFSVLKIYVPPIHTLSSISPPKPPPTDHWTPPPPDFNSHQSLLSQSHFKKNVCLKKHIFKQLHLFKKNVFFFRFKKYPSKLFDFGSKLWRSCILFAQTLRFYTEIMEQGIRTSEWILVGFLLLIERWDSMFSGNILYFFMNEWKEDLVIQMAFQVSVMCHSESRKNKLTPIGKTLLEHQSGKIRGSKCWRWRFLSSTQK